MAPAAWLQQDAVRWRVGAAVRSLHLRVSEITLPLPLFYMHGGPQLHYVQCTQLSRYTVYSIIASLQIPRMF